MQPRQERAWSGRYFGDNDEEDEEGDEENVADKEEEVLHGALASCFVERGEPDPQVSKCSR